MLKRLQQSANRFSQRAAVHEGASVGQQQAGYSTETRVRSQAASRGALVAMVLAICATHVAVFTHPCPDVHPTDSASDQPWCALGLQRRESLRISEGIAFMLVLSTVSFAVVHGYVWGSQPGYVSREDESPVARPRGVRDGEIDHVIGERWCLYCELWQPMRTKHCSQCGRCVRRFDHHCFWVSACVGQENHPRFVAMLAHHTAFMGLALFAVIESMDVAEESPSWTGFCFTITGFGICMIGLTLGLLMFHVYLMATGQTTWELVIGKGITYLRHQPNRFNRGLVRNVWHFIWPPKRWNAHEVDAAQEMYGLRPAHGEGTVGLRVVDPDDPDYADEPHTRVAELIGLVSPPIK